MSRPQLQHQPNRFMIFDMAINGHSALPLTVDQVFDELSEGDGPLLSPNDERRYGRVEESLYLPTTSPSTQNSSFKFFDSAYYDKLRGESFSSDESAPDMVEDHAGTSESDVDPAIEHDPYEESMGRLWDTYDTLLDENKPSEATVSHRAYPPNSSDDFQFPLPPSASPYKASIDQSHIQSGPPTEAQTIKLSCIPVSTRHQQQVQTSSHQRRERLESQSINRGDPLPPIQEIGLHRSDAQRSARPRPNTSKSLPALPHKRPAASSLRPSFPHKRPKSQEQQQQQQQTPPKTPPNPSQSTEHHSPTHRRELCIGRSSTSPATNPCNSSHAYSIHRTPLPRLSPPSPLSAPALVAHHLPEKSVFEYDSDDNDNGDMNGAHGRKTKNNNSGRGSNGSDHTADRKDPTIITNLSTALAAKMHIRGLSLPSIRLRLSSNGGGGRESGANAKREEPGRRRSATELFLGAFGLGKKH